MAFYKADPLNHFKRVREAVASMGGEAALDLETFRLELRCGETRTTLRPQFIAFPGGVKQYTPRFEAGVTRFIGWCPYFNKRWDIASQKLKFKRHAVEHGVRTPEYSRSPAEPMRDVIVKRNASSFAATIRGPFRCSSEHALDASEGEYFERFVPGTIAKVWYWDARPICLEMERMPTVLGDGVSTLRELAMRRLRDRGTRLDVESLRAFLAYQGLTLETVLPKDAEQAVEFRYGSPLLVPDDSRSIEGDDAVFARLEPQLAAMGAALVRAIPEDIRRGTVFTMDAIIDADDLVWALEMNSNPFIHPAVYVPMIASLTSTREAPGACVQAALRGHSHPVRS